MKVTKVRKPTSITRGMLLYLIVMSSLSPMLVAIFGVWYTGSSQKNTELKFRQLQVQSDARWCNLMRGIDQPPTVTPKVKLTPRQIAIQQTLHQLRLDLHC